jgi:hypothetical protein
LIFAARFLAAEAVESRRRAPGQAGADGLRDLTAATAGERKGGAP